MTRISCDFCLDIYYQNVRGLKIKYVNFYDSGALIVISQSVSGIKCRFDVKLINVSVLVEIKIPHGCNLLIGNHYIPADTKFDFSQSYFNHLESILYTQNYCVVLIGDFNIPNFDWEHGLSVNNCDYYSKQKGDTIFTFTCVLGPT
jgi:hypothetical protein